MPADGAREGACAPPARRSTPSGSTTELDALEQLSTQGETLAAEELLRRWCGRRAAPAPRRRPRRASSRHGRLVDTRQLAAFVAVVERGSFSLAADELGVTQPAVSLAVRSLEKRLGARLLDRGGAPGRADGRRPRRAGPRAAHARARAGDLRDAARRGRHARRPPDGRRLDRTRRAAAAAPAGRVPRASTPRRRSRSRIDATQDVIDRVLARELELGVVGAERPHRSLEYEPFAADEIVLAVPAGHPFAGRETHARRAADGADRRAAGGLGRPRADGARAAPSRRAAARPRRRRRARPAGVGRHGGRRGPRRDVHVARLDPQRDRARLRRARRGSRASSCAATTCWCGRPRASRPGSPRRSSRSAARSSPPSASRAATRTAGAAAASAREHGA